MYTIERETYKGYTIRIKPDDDPIDPRDADNLTTLVLFHRRYNLGDKHDYHTEDFASWDALEKQLAKDGTVIRLPVFGYDHGGLSISTQVERGWYHYSWDGGRLGFAVVFRKDVEKLMGWKRITKERLAKLLGYAQAEVRTYAAYVAGEYVGYTITDQDGNEVDSCWGFCDTADALSQAKDSVDNLPEQPERSEAWKLGHVDFEETDDAGNPFEADSQEYLDWEAGWKAACNENTDDQEAED